MAPPKPSMTAPAKSNAKDSKYLDSVDATTVPGLRLRDEPPVVYPDKQVWEELTRRRQKRRHDELLGVRSLQIDFQRTMGDNAIAFRSLGVDPVLAVTLSNRARFGALAWAVGIFTAVIGLLLTCRKRVAVQPTWWA